MHDWLPGAIASGGPVVTANLRLTRVLRKEYGNWMLSQGNTAWRTPQIVDLRQWLKSSGLLAKSTPPRVIEPEHCQILWERVLKNELGDADANLSRLAKDARKTRERLVEYCVPVAEVGAYAYGEDQRLFAAALNRYLQLLARQGWTDRAGLFEHVIVMIRDRQIDIPSSVCFAGFLNETPIYLSLKNALEDAGCAIHEQHTEKAPSVVLANFVDDREELRTAGAWARQLVEDNPTARVAIIVNDLEERAFEATHDVREGFCPGWQLHESATARLVNVSLGRRLADYPAIFAAGLTLRWMTGPLTAPDISILLRSPSIGNQDDDSRSNCEIALRDVPDREWRLDEFINEYSREDNALRDLLSTMKVAADLISRDQSGPSQFARQFDEALRHVGWPGTDTLSSHSFQLIDRWRESLNQLAALQLTEPSLRATSALARLNALLSEAVFQPKAEEQGIDVLGPLEAVGIEHDAIWISGMSSENWPGSRRPDPLLSRELQLKYRMPDAQAELVYAASERLFHSLSHASSQLVLGFAQFDGDAERSPSPLIPSDTEVVEIDEPISFAERMLAPSQAAIANSDPVPPVLAGERVFGGAAAIDRQATSPFDAFALSRLGIKPLWPFNYAFSPKDRGIYVHDALARFYTTGLRSSDIRKWTESEVRERARDASYKTFQSAFRGKTSVQSNILRNEEARMAQLLVNVWVFDCARSPDFEIVQLEERESLILETLKLHLQADRIDQMPDGSTVVLDYKTGNEKRLIEKDELTSFQLVLYAMADKSDTAGIGLYNVNSTGINIKGAGEHLSKDPNLFKDNISEWQAIAAAHARQLVNGDVRVLAQQSLKDSRRTGLLSRVRELLRDA